MNRIHRSLHTRANTLRHKAVELARDVEAEFGKDDDRTIFAKNVYCDLWELANTIEGEDQQS